MRVKKKQSADILYSRGTALHAGEIWLQCERSRIGEAIVISPQRTKELLNILRHAERRFGPRQPGWTIKPVVVEGKKYPQTLVDESKKTVQVRITESTKKHPEQAIFQLSHEAIHCLAPVNGSTQYGLKRGSRTTFHSPMVEFPRPRSMRTKR